jgi:hypothetical protein
MRLFLFASLLSIFVVSSAAIAYAASPVDSIGFQETNSDRALIEKSLSLTNDILGQRSKFRLAASWQPAPENVDRADLVTVFAVAPSGTDDDFSVMVPFDCGCIFLQPEIFLASIKRYSDASPQMLKFDPHDALAFMLLHEVGHIDHGDPGKYQSRKGTPAYNFDSTDQKEAETSADKFGADMLAAAAEDKAGFKGWIASMNIQMALTNISWNLSTIRHLDNFGASVLCSKFVFADDGYTHPNYELRVLTTNDLLIHNEASAELLQSFQACRKGARPNLLPSK